MSDQIVVGCFGSPHGIKGWIKVNSYTQPALKILDYLPWVTVFANRKLVIDQLQSQSHGHHLVVKLNQCHNRDDAKAYTHCEIFIEKAQLPLLPNDEYYWVDLIGLTVINQAQHCLGTVDSLIATGANDVLVVKEGSAYHYIPYIDHVVITVDLINKQLIVDWDKDY